jgi:Uma2 family endonuclease
METQQTISDYERERGKPMPSKLHSVVQTNLIVTLSAYRPEYTTLSELTLRLGNRDLTPDLCIYRDLEIDFTQDETRVTEPPLVAVEIASPTQGMQDLINKIRFLLTHGVQSCWLVQPQLRTITVFTEGAEPRTYSDGTVADPITDIVVELAEVFTTA